MSEIVQTCPNFSKLVLNLSKLAQTYLELVQTGSNWSKLVQMIRETAFFIKLDLEENRKVRCEKVLLLQKLNLKTLLELQIMHGSQKYRRLRWLL